LEELDVLEEEGTGGDEKGVGVVGMGIGNDAGTTDGTVKSQANHSGESDPVN